MEVFMSFRVDENQPPMKHGEMKSPICYNSYLSVVPAVTTIWFPSKLDPVKPVKEQPFLTPIVSISFLQHKIGKGFRITNTGKIQLFQII
jgi:hypothetical protein